MAMVGFVEKVVFFLIVLAHILFHPLGERGKQLKVVSNSENFHFPMACKWLGCKVNSCMQGFCVYEYPDDNPRVSFPPTENTHCSHPVID
jgi:hypothetical protein